MDPFEYLRNVSADIFATMIAEPRLLTGGFDEGGFPADWSIAASKQPLHAEDIRMRIAGVIAASTTQSAFTTWLEAALNDGDGRIRGAAWVMINSAWQRDRETFPLDEVSQAIKKRFGIKTTAVHTTPEALAQSWIEILGSVANLCIARARFLGTAERMKAALARRESEDELAARADPELLGQLLESTQISRRLQAITEVLDRRATAPPLVRRLLTIAKEDSSEMVQGRAIHALSMLLNRTKERNVLKVLAEIVSNRDERQITRVLAYRALLGIDGRADERLSMPSAIESVDAAFARINWNLVASCLDS